MRRVEKVGHECTIVIFLYEFLFHVDPGEKHTATLALSTELIKCHSHVILTKAQSLLHLPNNAKDHG